MPTLLMLVGCALFGTGAYLALKKKPAKSRSTETATAAVAAATTTKTDDKTGSSQVTTPKAGETPAS